MFKTLVKTEAITVDAQAVRVRYFELRTLRGGQRFSAEIVLGPGDRVILDDDSVANLVASGLFGDGAAAVVLVGDQREHAGDVRGPWIVDSRSHLYPDTERAMGWDVGSGGLKIVLGSEVPDLVAQ